MVDIETGVLPAGHPYARIGTGSRIVLYIPGLSFTAEPASIASTRRSWKRWLEPIARHDLTIVHVGRRADLPPGSTAADLYLTTVSGLDWTPPTDLITGHTYRWYVPALELERAWRVEPGDSVSDRVIGFSPLRFGEGAGGRGLASRPIWAMSCSPSPLRRGGAGGVRSSGAMAR